MKRFIEISKIKCATYNNKKWGQIIEDYGKLIKAIPNRVTIEFYLEVEVNE